METISIILANILLFFAIYGFILVLSGSFYKPIKRKSRHQLPRIKVILPAYKPDPIFIKVLSSLKIAIKNYPIQVTILFQNADDHIVSQCMNFGFKIIKKNFDHLEGNSYQRVLKFLCEEELSAKETPFMLILDKDNIVDSDFFDQLSYHDLEKYHIIQGIRKPLSVKDGLQIFDAISERYNDLMLRMGKCQLGGILEVSGSAAVMDTDLFIRSILRLDCLAPGFDKNYMVKILTDPVKLKTCFDKELIVREEKTSDASNYKSQRLRWFGEQYFNAYYNFSTLISAALLKGKFRSLDYWITLVRPPRSFQLSITLLLFLVDLVDMQIGTLSLPFAVNLTSFLIVSLPLLTKVNPATLLVGGKVLFLNMIASITCLKKKYLNVFIHTR